MQMLRAARNHEKRNENRLMMFHGNHAEFNQSCAEQLLSIGFAMRKIQRVKDLNLKQILSLQNNCMCLYK